MQTLLFNAPSEKCIFMLLPHKTMAVAAAVTGRKGAGGIIREADTADTIMLQNSSGFKMYRLQNNRQRRIVATADSHARG